MRGALRIHEADNVATAIADIAPGEALFADRDIRAAVAVERGHNIALAPITRGEAVTPYGFSNATAPADPPPGAHVTSTHPPHPPTNGGQDCYPPPPPRPTHRPPPP